LSHQGNIKYGDHKKRNVVEPIYNSKRIRLKTNKTEKLGQMGHTHRIDFQKMKMDKGTPKGSTKKPLEGPGSVSDLLSSQGSRYGTMISSLRCVKRMGALEECFECE
jgi:hypothetical protein